MSFAARDADDARKIRDSLDADFAAGRLGILNGWLVDLEHLADDGTGRLFPEPLVDLVTIDPSLYESPPTDGPRPL